jgi:hypothetical protein
VSRNWKTFIIIWYELRDVRRHAVRKNDKILLLHVVPWTGLVPLENNRRLKMKSPFGRL